MRTLIITFLLFIAPHVGLCVSVQEDTLKFYIVSENPIAGGRFIDTPDCPKVGYITNTPNLVITRLESVSTNTTTSYSFENGKSSAVLTPAILINMYGPDAAKFADLTRQNIHRRILICLGERPLIASQIDMPIESGDFQITLGNGKDFEAITATLKKFVR